MGHSAWTCGECGPLARVPCVCPGRVRWGRASLRKPAPYRPTGPAEGDWLELPAHLPTPACSVRARSPMLSLSLVLVVCPFCPPASQSREGKVVVTTQAFHLIQRYTRSPSPHLVLEQEDQAPVFKGHTGRFCGQALQVWK